MTPENYNTSRSDASGERGNYPQRDLSSCADSPFLSAFPFRTPHFTLRTRIRWRGFLYLIFSPMTHLLLCGAPGVTPAPVPVYGRKIKVLVTNRRSLMLLTG